MSKGESQHPGKYERRVRAQLGMHTPYIHALYTELFESSFPWKDLAGRVAEMEAKESRIQSNLAAWESMRRGLLAEFVGIHLDLNK
jgi:hypothetical protein